jgi:hypothetical protein
MRKPQTSPLVGGLAAMLLAGLSATATAQFNDVIDFGTNAGQLSPANNSFIAVTNFGTGYTASYSPDTVNFTGSLPAGANTGLFYTLQNPIVLNGVNQNTQRVQLGVTIGPNNQAENVTLPFAELLFGSGFFYNFQLANLAPGSYNLLGPTINGGGILGTGTGIDLSADPIEQVTFFSGNFSGGGARNVDFSIDSVSFITPPPPVAVPAGTIEFGPVLEQRAFSNGSFSTVDTRGNAPTPLNAPSDAAGGLRFSGLVPSNTLSGKGVGLSAPVNLSPPSNPLDRNNDPLVLDIEVGQANQIREIIFEVIATTGAGGTGGDFAKSSWRITGIEDLAPGPHRIVAQTFAQVDDGTSGGIFEFDPELDEVGKIVVFGLNFNNEDEPFPGPVTPKQMDISIKRVQFGLPVTAALPGDFNADGFVNAADYTVWRDNFNGPESTLMGNGNGSGTVDQADYTLWTTNRAPRTTEAGSGTATAVLGADRP